MANDSLSFSLHLDGSQLFERARPGQKKRLTFTPPKQGGKCCAWGQIAFVLLPLYSLHHGLNGRLPWRCTEGLLLIGHAERVAADERSGKADAARADTSFSCSPPHLHFHFVSVSVDLCRCRCRSRSFGFTRHHKPASSIAASHPCKSAANALRVWVTTPC